MTLLSFFNAHGWAEHPVFTQSQWRDEVTAGDTELGYIGWVIEAHEAEGVAYTLDAATQASLVPQDDATDADQERFPFDDWRREVQESHTRLGYNAWVLHQVEADADSDGDAA